MIIQITGTSGSGKTWAVRQFLDRASSIARVEGSLHEGGRPRTLALWVTLPQLLKHPPVYVIGNYDVPCGGADTIKLPERNYREVLDRHFQGYPVVFEGLYMHNHMRGVDMVRNAGVGIGGVTLLALNTPFEVCAQRVHERRAERAKARGLIYNAKPPKHTDGNWVRAQNYNTKMRQAGARVIDVSPEVVADTILELLK